MNRMIVAAVLLTGATLSLAGCDDAAPANNGAKAAAAPDTLPAGEYEVQAKVTSLRSTDGKVPLVKHKEGDVITSKGCVDAKGVPAPALFAAAGDECSVQNPYFSGGTINVTLSCTRKGVNGRIMVNVDGETTATGLKGHAVTTTFIDGPGDYDLKTELTGKRVGVCPPAA
ncbi:MULTISPECIES: DUF3617 domain-containing protein [Sphingomonas]|uniref:DUF3617 domain-containing protein n=1 Tax=Sphingomonas TaxID=13687 RepID=UPI000DEEF8E2|nr:MULTISPECIES: DUF3617 family protein [Sphingomonas]